MNISDFRYMRRGKHIAALRPEDAHLMEPITHHETTEKNRALLIFHGFTSSPAVFRYMWKEFIPYYDAIFIPLLPGHGDNLTAFAQVKNREWLEMAEEKTAELSREYKQLDVLGFSLGGVLACHIAGKFPLHHLFLLAPALRIYTPIKRSIYFARILNFLGFKSLRTVAGDIYGNEHAELAFRQLPVQTSLEILYLLKEFNLPPINCPTNVLLGRQDHVVNSPQVATLFAKQKDIKLHWFENSAHVMPLDEDMHQILACLKKYMAAIP